MSTTSPDLVAVGREFGLTEACYSINEAARKLGISRAFLYELVAAGDLEIIHIGKKPVVTAPSIARLIEHRRQAAQAKRAARAVPQSPPQRAGRRS
jgi:excisionase family DNA binding protein